MQADCPERKVAIGGGYHADGRGGLEVVVHEPAPSPDPEGDNTWTANGWMVRASNPSGQNAQVQSYVVCAR